VSRLAGLAAAAIGALLLSGCAYDYLQRTDRVGYNAGDAVKANLAIQTTDPANPASYRTRGLGRNGYVIPAPVADAAAP
jgi:hypothetical protein